MKLRELIEAYRTDRDSGFAKVRFATRENYARMLIRVDAAMGERELDGVKARDLLRQYERWRYPDGPDGPDRIAMSHGLVTALRLVLGFGATILEEAECKRLREALAGMRFRNCGARTNRLTAGQASAICDAAYDHGVAIIALAQAFAFELMLRQKDVIGEWVPVCEPGASAIVHEGEKWLRGIRREEIDADLWLHHETSKKGKPLEVDLKLAPMIMDELHTMPASGPIIVDRDTGLPYKSHKFRRAWRLLARDAGIPEEVWNMDSRSGGITEATDAGAELEHVRHAATHSNVSMTQRYSRGSRDKIVGVMKRRVEHRAALAANSIDKQCADGIASATIAKG